LRPSPPTAPRFAIRSDPPQAIGNGLAGYPELSRHGGLARFLDKISPFTARSL